MTSDDIMLSEITQLKKDKCASLYVILRIVKLREVESTMVAARCLGRKWGVVV